MSRIASILLLVFLAAAPLSAQAPDPAPAETKPADAIVRTARLAFFAGAVEIGRADNTGSDAPVLNMPLGAGTRITTADYGQAEIEFEDGSVARMTPRSALSIDVLTLASSVAQTHLTVLGGLVYFELRKAPTASYTVDVGGTMVSPVENLTLRVNLDEPPAIFAVLAGAAHLERTDAFETDVKAGESLRTDADDPTRYFLTTQIADESWDQWNRSRDQLAVDDGLKRTAARDGYAANQGYGWSDLDANGSWYDMPGQGNVWQPDNADDAFDPYSDGAWVWSGGGYTWASGYAWGWTPYRCGQWLFFPGFGWAWQPDAACGRWGYYGFSGSDTLIFASGGGPPRHRPIARPIPPPGRPHPILPVRGPNGLRPPVVIGGPIMISGKHIEPLRPIGTVAAAGALNRDYPVDAKTHEPVLGKQPGTTPYLHTGPYRPMPDGVPVNTQPGRVDRSDRSDRSDRQERTHTTTTPAPTHTQPAAPASTRSAPAPAPAPSHPAPAPGPAPSHTEPAAATKVK